MRDKLALQEITKVATLLRATKVRNDNPPPSKAKLYLLYVDRECNATNFLEKLFFI